MRGGGRAAKITECEEEREREEKAASPMLHAEGEREREIVKNHENRHLLYVRRVALGKRARQKGTALNISHRRRHEEQNKSHLFHKSQKTK